MYVKLERFCIPEIEDYVGAEIVCTVGYYEDIHSIYADAKNTTVTFIPTTMRLCLLN